MDVNDDELRTKVVDLDITPEQWPAIIRSRLAFGLAVTQVMMYAPRELHVTHDRIVVRVPEKMAGLWEQWTKRLHRQCETLLLVAQRLDVSFVELSAFIEGGTIQ